MITSVILKTNDTNKPSKTKIKTSKNDQCINYNFSKVLNKMRGSWKYSEQLSHQFSVFKAAFFSFKTSDFYLLSTDQAVL